MHFFQVEYLKAIAFRYFLLCIFISENCDARVLQVSWRESRLNAMFGADGKPDFLYEDYVFFNCPVAGETGVLARTENMVDLFSAFYGFDLSRKTSIFFGTGFVQIATKSEIEASGVDPLELEADLNSIGCRSRNRRVARGLTDAVVSIRNEQRFGSFGFELNASLSVPLDENPLIVGEPGRKLSSDIALTPSYGKKTSIAFPLEFRVNFPSNSFDRTVGVRLQTAVENILLSAGILRIEQFGAESVYQNNGSDSLNYVFDALISFPTDAGAIAVSYQRSLAGVNAVILDSFEVSLVLFKL